MATYEMRIKTKAELLTAIQVIDASATSVDELKDGALVFTTPTVLSAQNKMDICALARYIVS